MGKRNRECYLCGQSYQYCPTCSQDKTKPAWMIEFHSEDCKNIFDICTRFNLKRMSKSEAKAALNSCDLSNKANFKSYVQRDLENIFKEDPKPKRGKRSEIKIIDEIANIEVATVKETVSIEPDDVTHEVVEKEN